MTAKKKMLAGSAATLLLISLVAGVSAAAGQGNELGPNGFGMKRGGFHGDRTASLEELGLEEGATRQEIREAAWQKKLSVLGLTEDSTVGEFHDKMVEFREARHAERLDMMREKLGLGDDATEDEIHEGMKTRREENGGYGKGRMGGSRHGGMRAGRGGCLADGVPEDSS